MSAKLQTAAERRKHPREELSMVFEILDGSQELRGQNRGQIVNLSEGGAAFESDAFLKKGQSIAFELPLPVRIQAKILRVQEGVRNRYGVQFVKVTAGEKRLLKIILASARTGKKKS